MLDMDFKLHNARSREVWDTWHAGDPIRVPVTIYADSRNWMAEPQLNTNKITLPDYLRDPELMLQVQVRAREWIRCNILSDDGMGLPDEGWPLIVDFQNYLEMAWFGAEVHYTSEPECSDGFGFADDAIVILSTDLYESFILPCHRKIFSTLTTGDNNRSFHLCGDAQRFFPIMQNHLNVRSFDTGFPIQFEKLYDELDADTCIIGGPPVGLLLNGTPMQIDQKVREILNSSVMAKSRRFVLREANALAPGTPLDNVNQIYRTCEKAGLYKGAANEH